jgi:prevent-host-death family protein
MRYSTQIKPISYVKAHAAELLDRITEEREPIIITQNGEARAVLVDVHSYDASQETMAMWQILAIGKQQMEAGQTYPLAEVIAKIRNRGAKKPETEGVYALSATEVENEKMAKWVEAGAWKTEEFKTAREARRYEIKKEKEEMNRRHSIQHPAQIAEEF